MPRPVLFVSHADALGGAERSLLLLLTFLERSRWQLHLVAPDGLLAEDAARVGTTVHRMVLPRLRGSSHTFRDWWQTAARIGAIARAINAVLIHSTTVRATGYAALAALLSSVPFVWHMRDFWLSETQPRVKWADRLGKMVFYALASRVLTNSQAVADLLPCSAKVSVLYNGIDLSRFDRPVALADHKVEICKAAGWVSDAPIVGMVGRLRPWKGQETFLQMASHINATMPQCRFLVVGGDPFVVEDGYEKRLLALRSALGLEGLVHFSGQLQDVRPALAAMDLFVHPGAPEPFGLVNVEAMAMGKPVVAFAHGALPEIVVHDETGLLVPAGDVAALSKSVAQLVQTPEICQRMGRAGRQRVEDRFRIERVVVELEHLWRTIVVRGE